MKRAIVKALILSCLPTLPGWCGNLVTLDSAPPPTRGRLLWRYRGGGRVRPLLALTNDLILAVTDDRRIHALSRARGRRQWLFETASDLNWPSASPGAVSMRPAIGVDCLYVSTRSLRLVAVSLATGTKRWSASPRVEVLGAPLLHAGSLVVAIHDERIAALDTETGALRWVYRIGAPRQTPPLAAQDLILVGSRDSVLHAIDAESGARRWKTRTEGVPESLALCGRGLLCAVTSEGFSYFLDAQSGRRLWLYRTGRAVSPPVGTSDVVTLATRDGRLLGLHPEGGQVLWRERSFWARRALWSRDEPPIHSPVADEDVVCYASYLQNFLHGVSLHTGQELWRLRGAPSYVNPPSLSEGVVYLGNREDALLAIEAATGRLVWRFDTRSRVTTTPLVAGDVVYFATRDGLVLAVSLSGEGAR